MSGRHDLAVTVAGLGQEFRARDGAGRALDGIDLTIEPGGPARSSAADHQVPPAALRQLPELTALMALTAKVRGAITRS